MEKRKLDEARPRLQMDAPKSIPLPPQLSMHKYKIDNIERIVRADFSHGRCGSHLTTCPNTEEKLEGSRVAMYINSWLPCGAKKASGTCVFIAQVDVVGLIFSIWYLGIRSAATTVYQRHDAGSRQHRYRHVYHHRRPLYPTRVFYKVGTC